MMNTDVQHFKYTDRQQHVRLFNYKILGSVYTSFFTQDTTYPLSERSIPAYSLLYLQYHTFIKIDKFLQPFLRSTTTTQIYNT